MQASFGTVVVEGAAALETVDGMLATAKWPLTFDEAAELAPPRDPWAGLVRASLEDYAAGRPDRASLTWDEAIVWRVAGLGPMSGLHVGRDAIFDYHRRLRRVSDDTFGQRVLVLRASGGPIVRIDVHTTAAVGERRLDIKTQLVFEVGEFRLRRVTELPEEQAAWDQFWGALTA
jgi:hypothetical protein